MGGSMEDGFTSSFSWVHLLEVRRRKTIFGTFSEWCHRHCANRHRARGNRSLRDRGGSSGCEIVAVCRTLPSPCQGAASNCERRTFKRSPRHFGRSQEQSPPSGFSGIIKSIGFGGGRSRLGGSLR